MIGVREVTLNMQMEKKTENRDDKWQPPKNASKAKHEIYSGKRLKHFRRKKKLDA